MLTNSAGLPVYADFPHSAAAPSNRVGVNLFALNQCIRYLFTPLASNAARGGCGNMPM